MSSKHKVLMLFFCLLLMILSGCTDRTGDNQILARVNGENIYNSDMDLMRNQYAGRNLSESDLLCGIVKERLILQHYADGGKEISEEDIDSQFQQLKDIQYGDVFFRKAIDTYGSEEAVKESIKYRLMYNSVKEELRYGFSKMLYIDQEQMKKRTDDFVSQIDSQSISEEELENYRAAVLAQYEQALTNELFDLYFSVWINQLAAESDIMFFSDIKAPFVKKDSIVEESSLKTVSFTEAQEVYGNFLYLPKEMELYDGITLLGYHDTTKQQKVLSVEYITSMEKTPVYILLEVSPDLNLLKSERKTHEGDRTQFEITFSEIGVRYTISSSLDGERLKQEIDKMIPYSVVAQN